MAQGGKFGVTKVTFRTVVPETDIFRAQIGEIMREDGWSLDGFSVATIKGPQIFVEISQ